MDITFYNLGYVVFAVSTNRAVSGETTGTTSPKTGRPLYEIMLPVLLIVVAAGYAVVALRRRKEG